MIAGNQIIYITHQHIDRQKWDACIDKAPNGLIYAYSFYLDAMAKNWDALVLNDYETVMPLTWNSKFGFSYLYQPAFTAMLGVFGKNINEELFSDFIKAIPRKFRFIEISLNTGNVFEKLPPGFFTRTNYVLDLNKPYSAITEAYRENHKRNISKAGQEGCSIKKNIPVDEIIHLNRAFLQGISKMKNEDYLNFKKLYELLKPNQLAETYGLINKNKQLLASCVFFFSQQRAYYILVGNTKEGKNTGASHALIDTFIKDHAGKDLLLDFEGSDIESLAFFYAGFGAKEELYPALKINKLPWYIRGMKQ